MLHNLFSQILKTDLLDKRKFEPSIVNMLVDCHCNAYHKNRYLLGRKIGCYLIENDVVARDVKHVIENNQLVYLITLKNISECTVHNLCPSIFELENPKEEYKNGFYNPLNPSIYNDNGDLYVNVRHVSFTGANYTPATKDEVIKTKNTFGKLIDNKLCEDYNEIVDTASYMKVDNRVIGFEDLKIFKKKGKWCFVCTSYEASKTTLVLYGILDEEPSNGIWKTQSVIPLKGKMVSENIPEKNWMPILSEEDDNIDLLYSTFPFHIVRLNKETNEVETILKKEWSRTVGNWRGSSCLVPYKAGYMYIIHEVYFVNNTRNYIHRLVWIKKDYSEILYSDPFFMEKNNRIEYCNGLAISNQKFYITYGDGDRMAKMIILPEDKALLLLENSLR